MKTDFFSLNATTLQGKEVSMDTYKNKVIIVVNNASKCGFTPQYEGLEELHRTYKDKGLVILGFPCNQFGNQEPGSEKDIAEGCLINYGVSFPMFSKVDVNGENAFHYAARAGNCRLLRNMISASGLPREAISACACAMTLRMVVNFRCW